MTLKQLTHFAYIASIILILSSAAACSRAKELDGLESSYSGVERSRTHIPLDAVQAASGCLNIPLYSMAVRLLRPDLSIFEATTSFKFQSRQTPREAFLLLAAFGNYVFEQHRGSDSIDLQGWTQDGCSSLTYISPDGQEEKFRVTERRPDFLSVESESGAYRSFRWVSDSKIELMSNHKALDLPCTNEEARVRIVRVFDWSGAIPDTLKIDDPLYVEGDYLQMLASATGIKVEDLYQNVPETPEVPDSRVLITAKLVELAKSNVRQELISCSGYVPPVTPPPADPQDPEGPNPPDPIPPNDPTDPRRR